MKIGRRAESGSRCGLVKEGRKEGSKLGRQTEPGPSGGGARRGARAAAQTLASSGAAAGGGGGGGGRLARPSAAPGAPGRRESQWCGETREVGSRGVGAAVW